MTSVRRSLVGAGAALGAVAVLAAIMTPLRSHVSIATAALVLVIPVVIGVVTGGFAGRGGGRGRRLLRLRPSLHPPLRHPDGRERRRTGWPSASTWWSCCSWPGWWPASMWPRSQAHRREAEIRRLFELTDLLIGEKPVPELLALIVSAVHDAFGLRSVVLLLPVGIPSGARPPPPGSRSRTTELGRITPAPGRPDQPGHRRRPAPTTSRRVALSATGRPVGLLGSKVACLSRYDRELLLTFANHIALTVERAQLREQALRTELLEEIDRLQKTLMGAVSHDLRTPLATIKISATTLSNPGADLGTDERRELLGLIEDQVDRLNRLVTNLLDMSRVQSGALELHRTPVAVVDLVTEAARGLGLADTGRLVVDLAEDLPLVDVDHLLVGQVLTNLLDNASRYAPDDTPITVSGRTPRRRTRRGGREPTADPGCDPTTGPPSSRCSPAAFGRGIGRRTVDRQGLRRGPRRGHLGGGRRRPRRPFLLHPPRRPSTGHAWPEPWPVSSPSTTTPPCCGSCASDWWPWATRCSPPPPGPGASPKRRWGPPTSIVLDLGLPDMDGLEVCRRIREWSAVPIIVLVGRRDRGPQDRRPRRGGRRLHDQTLRHGRARSRACGWPCATARRRTTVTNRRR